MCKKNKQHCINHVVRELFKKEKEKKQKRGKNGR